MRLSSNEIKGWLGLVIAIQVLCIVAFVFCHDMYIQAYAWIREAPAGEWEWLMENPCKYSADVDFLLGIILDSQEIFGRGFRLAVLIGLIRVAFYKKTRFPIGKKQIAIVLAGGVLLFTGWLLYCRYGIEHYALALEVVPLEILSLMLLAFILIGRKQGNDSPAPPTP